MAPAVRVLQSEISYKVYCNGLSQNGLVWKGPYRSSSSIGGRDATNEGEVAQGPIRPIQ